MNREDYILFEGGVALSRSEGRVGSQAFKLACYCSTWNCAS